MGFELLPLLERLGISLDCESGPMIRPGVISWVGRIKEVTPKQLRSGLANGMEIWSSGQGFAPLDSIAIESWLIDLPRGDHLLISFRDILIDKDNFPIRPGRDFQIWSKGDFAKYIGEAVMDGMEISVNDIEITDNNSDQIVDEDIFSGTSPYALKADADFSLVIDSGLDIASSKPILLEAKLYKVKGILIGPVEENVQSWVLNCGGLFKIDEIKLFERPPMLRRTEIEIIQSPDFGDLLSERRHHNEGNGALLRWWKFQNETAEITEYDVLVPAHIGSNAMGENWIFNNLTCTLHYDM